MTHKEKRALAAKAKRREIKEQQKEIKDKQQLQQNNSEDVIIAHSKLIINNSDYSAEEKKEFLDVIVKGWKYYTDGEKYETSAVFLNNTVLKEYKDIISRNKKLPESLSLLSNTELLTALGSIVDKDNSWATTYSVALTSEVIRLCGVITEV